MMLVDAHVHCVPLSMREEFFRIGFDAFFRQFPAGAMKEPIEGLLSDMEKAGVDTSVVVTAGGLEIFDDYAYTHPGKLYVALIFDSRNPKEGLRNLRKTVERHRHLVKSVKTAYPYLGQHPAQKEFSPLYRYCEERNLPIQFHMGGDPRMEELSHVVYFGKLCSLFPDLRVICLHAGGGQVGAIAVLAKLWENVYVELEGLQLTRSSNSGCTSRRGKREKREKGKRAHDRRRAKKRIDMPQGRLVTQTR
ncbi:MAG: amidohydrolase family protein [Candidatus Lindowbacteria bacterium]|nr:amidohydrolase family protein [Candidatus Lindowbacteria bacterium]